MLLAASLLLIFSLASVINTDPLYRGLGWIGHNQLISTMQAVSNPGASWAVTDTLVFENFGLVANRDSISGVQPYPDIKLWSQADPKANYIYNRYAHVLFINNPNFNKPLELVQNDFFEVALKCNQFTESNIDFVLDTEPDSKSCLQLKGKVVYPAATFYLYHVVKNT